MLAFPFQGVYPILYAFFDGQDQLDREAMRRLRIFSAMASVLLLGG